MSGLESLSFPFGEGPRGGNSSISCSMGGSGQSANFQACHRWCMRVLRWLFLEVGCCLEGHAWVIAATPGRLLDLVCSEMDEGVSGRATSCRTLGARQPSREVATHCKAYGCWFLTRATGEASPVLSSQMLTDARRMLEEGLGDQLDAVVCMP